MNTQNDQNNENTTNNTNIQTQIQKQSWKTWVGNHRGLILIVVIVLIIIIWWWLRKNRNRGEKNLSTNRLEVPTYMTDVPSCVGGKGLNIKRL